MNLNMRMLVYVRVHFIVNGVNRDLNKSNMCGYVYRIGGFKLALLEKRPYCRLGYNLTQCY